MIAIAIAVAAAAAPSPPNQYFQVYNYPSIDSCAKWTEYRTNKSDQVLEGWVLGFVTGQNAYRSGGGDVAHGTPGAGLVAWVDQYCAANPLDSVTTASFKLIKELDRRSSR